MLNGGVLPGYDSLVTSRLSAIEYEPRSFSPSAAYDTYFRIHKVLVGEKGGQQLEGIAEALSSEWLPKYLTVAGWAYAEAALVQPNKPAVERMHMVDTAKMRWEEALTTQEQINQGSSQEWLREEIGSYRLALNLAYIPLLQGIVLGNITDKMLEQTFADTLAITQASIVERGLAEKEGDGDTAAAHKGFEYENNTLLTLLYMNDPRHIPLPSTSRGGSGYDYPEQTHDIVVINQHWGDILKVVPTEVKSKTSPRDLRRYNSLLVRGKMHLSLPGKYLPEDTTEAFREMYEEEPSALSRQIVTHATSTVKEMLQLYQKGQRIPTQGKATGVTRFHERNGLAERYGEVAVRPAKQGS